MSKSSRTLEFSRRETTAKPARFSMTFDLNPVGWNELFGAAQTSDIALII
jgi:hypothetical protein